VADDSRRFSRHTEDFVCGNCAREVVGTGYTNHCPGCLWSRHVDVLPGDRLASCGGLMEPIGLLYEVGRFFVVQRCVDCGHLWRNHTAEDDDHTAMLALAGEPVEWPDAGVRQDGRRARATGDRHQRPTRGRGTRDR
jgi:RNHCP domain